MVVIEYKNLFAYQDVIRLDIQVNEALKEGWKLKGNIKVTSSPHGVMFIQTMVKS